jgi:hypothetical protein
LTYEHVEGEDESTRQVANQFARTLLARDVKHIESFIARRHQLPKEWRNVSTLIHRPARFTPRQLRALGAELAEVLERHLPPPASDSTSPSEPEARPVTISIYAVPTDVNATDA